MLYVKPSEGPPSGRSDSSSTFFIKHTASKVIPGYCSAYSNISRTQRLPSFVPAALRTVLIALAVFPCFPIIFPISDLATRNSNTIVLSPATSATDTSSGMSTRAFAIFSISAFIPTSVRIRVVVYPPGIFSKDSLQQMPVVLWASCNVELLDLCC